MDHGDNYGLWRMLILLRVETLDCNKTLICPLYDEPKIMDPRFSSIVLSLCFKIDRLPVQVEGNGCVRKYSTGSSSLGGHYKFETVPKESHDGKID